MRSTNRLPRILAGRRRWLMARLLANGAGQASVSFAIAWLVARALEYIEAASAVRVPMITLAELVAAGLLLCALRALERADAERVGQDYVANVRLRLFTRLAAAPSRWNGQSRLGLTMTRMVTDLNGLKKWVSAGVARASVAGVTVLGCLAALAYFDLLLAGCMALLCALFVVLALLLTPTLRRRVRQARRRRGELAGNLGEKLSAMPTVVHFDRARGEWRHLRTQSRRLSGAMVRRMQIAGLLISLPDLVFPIGVAVVLQLNLIGHLSWAETLPALALLTMVVSSLRDLSRAWEYRASFEEARHRLSRLLAGPRARDPKNALELDGNRPISVTFEDVAARAGTLDGLTVHAVAGSRILISGSSGSGKTTLLALAERLFDPDRGRVLLDGVPIERLSRSCIHRAVQLVSPALPLLRGTLSENLAYGGKAHDAEWIAHVARVCRLGRADLPLASTSSFRIEENGRNLCDGLRARVALARALVATPRLLLVDDPAFSLDPAAIRALQEALCVFETTALIVTQEQRHYVHDVTWRLEHGAAIVTQNPREAAPLSLIWWNQS